MRIGVIVDGRAEYGSLDRIYPQLQARSGNVFLSPVQADIQPFAPTPVIAKACKAAIALLQAKGSDRIIVLVDRESRQECGSEIASSIAGEITRQFQAPVEVVVKNRRFENWLLADPDALAAQRRRYRVSNAVRRRIEPNRVDQVNDGIPVMKLCCRGDYEKVSDSRYILEQADADSMGGNSRSFRRFLRVAGHQRYRRQSRRP